MIEIQIILMSVSIIALCGAMIYIRKYVYARFTIGEYGQVINIDKFLTEMSTRLAQCEGNVKSVSVVLNKQSEDIRYLLRKQNENETTS